MLMFVDQTSRTRSGELEGELSKAEAGADCHDEWQEHTNQQWQAPLSGDAALWLHAGGEHSCSRDCVFRDTDISLNMSFKTSYP